MHILTVRNWNTWIDQEIMRNINTYVKLTNRIMRLITKNQQQFCQTAFSITAAFVVTFFSRSIVSSSSPILYNVKGCSN